MELDTIDTKAAQAFDGYLVRKDLVRAFSKQYPVPTYVVEFCLEGIVQVLMKRRFRKALK